jgi:CRP/FNR family transcriptional regulator, cyclic AMP receptor protein
MPTSRAAPSDLINRAPLDESLRALAHRGEVRRYSKGAVLIEEGDRGDTIFIILQGRLRAYSRHQSNQREITFGIYGAGEYVGEMGLDGGPRSASVVAVDTCTCARIGRPTLEAHIAANPGFAIELLAKVIRRARSATLSLKQIALNDVYGRVKLLLESMAQVQPDGSRLVLDRPTHEAISQQAGCGREMVSRVISELKKAGVLSDVPGGWRLTGALPPRW